MGPHSNAQVIHLSRIHFDNCALLLSLQQKANNIINKIIRFEIMWMSHPDLENIVWNTWSTSNNIIETTPTFTENVKE